MIALACRRNLGLGEQDPLYTPACLILPGLLVSLRLRKLPVGLEASRGKSQKVLEMAQKRIIPDANINTISVIIYLWPKLPFTTPFWRLPVLQEKKHSHFRRV